MVKKYFFCLILFVTYANSEVILPSFQIGIKIGFESSIINKGMLVDSVYTNFPKEDHFYSPSTIQYEINLSMFDLIGFAHVSSLGSTINVSSEGNDIDSFRCDHNFKAWEIFIQYDFLKHFFKEKNLYLRYSYGWIDSYYTIGQEIEGFNFTNSTNKNDQTIYTNGIYDKFSIFGVISDNFGVEFYYKIIDTSFNGMEFDNSHNLGINFLGYFGPRKFIIGSDF